MLAFFLMKTNGTVYNPRKKRGDYTRSMLTLSPTPCASNILLKSLISISSCIMYYSSSFHYLIISAMRKQESDELSLPLPLLHICGRQSVLSKNMAVFTVSQSFIEEMTVSYQYSEALLIANFKNIKTSKNKMHVFPLV